MIVFKNKSYTILTENYSIIQVKVNLLLLNIQIYNNTNKHINNRQIVNFN